MPADLRRTAIHGVFELVGQPFSDHRGAFLNAFRSQEPAFASSWGDRGIAQVNLSRSEAVGTIRGLHLQAAPHAEAKLVRCLRGRVWDVAVDLRAGSPTFLEWYAQELAPDEAKMLVIPEGFAHGFQVLEPESELLYLHTEYYHPPSEGGVRHDDPRLSIPWPLPPQDLSPRDLAHPLLTEAFSGVTL